MATNRITKHCAQWFKFLASTDLATRQEIVESRRRLAEGLARDMRKQREQRRLGGDEDCEGVA